MGSDLRVSLPRPPLTLLLGICALLAFAAMATPAHAEFGYLTEFGQAGPDEPLNGPRAVTVDLAGSVYVADTNNNRVRKSDANGQFIASFGPGSGGGELILPEGLAVDAQNNLYVADSGNARVVEFSSGGRYLREFRHTGTFGLTNPSGVAVAKDGRVVVTDASNALLHVFGPDGSHVNSLFLSSPARGVALTSDDVAVVALEGTSQIQLIGLDGRFENIFGGVFNAPVGVAMDPSGDFWVADTGNGRVARFTRAGGGGITFGSQSPNAAVDPADPERKIFASAHLIAVDCRGNLYVPDAGQNRVEKYGDPATPPPPCAPPPVSVGETFDLELSGIEVTQGTQTQTAKVDAVRDLPAGGVAKYDGVTLQRGGRTVVRVYANAIQGPPGGLTGVPVVLRGFRNGTPLQPGVLLPEGGPTVIVPRPGPVGLSQRKDPLGAYTFTLPWDWTTASDLTLEAEVNPAGFNPAVGGCATAECEVNDVRRLQVPFTATANILTLPVLLSANGNQKPRDADKAFNRVRDLLPIGLAVEPYRAVIDITDIVNAARITEESCFLFICDETSRDITADDKRHMALERLTDWADDVEPRSRYFVVGLVPGTLDGIMHGVVGSDTQAVGVLDAVRPITTMTHEFLHGLGIKHASAACGGGANGQVGEDWPPDQRGYLQGIGLDRAAASGGSTGPYRLIADPVQAPRGVATDPDPALSGAAYDLMSYCAANNPEWNTWISPRNWDRAAAFLRPGQAETARPAATTAPASLVRLTATARHIAVSGYVLPTGQAVITRAQRVDGAPRAGAGPITVIAFGADGAELSRVAARTATSSDGDLGPATTFSAKLPDGPVVRVEVQRDGVKLADVARSPAAPRLTLLSPRAGTVLGARPTVSVKWRASDRDPRAQLRIQVEYSTNGRSFRRVYDGPDKGSAALPRGLFTAANRARVRVRASDGLNETVVTSPPLKSLGAPPTVNLIAPAPGRVRADAVVVGEVSAYDDAGRRLTGRSLKWMIGTRVLATGARVSLLGLPAGRPTLRVVARDRRGRETTASVRLRVQPVKPFFLTLKAPAKVTRRAKSVTLRVASTVAAVLRGAGRPVAVDRTARVVTVPVRPGSKPVKLTLSLRSGGLRTNAAVTIAR